MKVIVMCGEHPVEGATIRLCFDLKKDGYTELKKLANDKKKPFRNFTTKDVVFINLSGQTLHAAAKEFSKLSLKDIIEAYERYLKSAILPGNIKEYLYGYVAFWKNWMPAGSLSEKDRERLPELKELKERYIKTKKEYTILRQVMLPPEFSWLLPDAKYYEGRGNPEGVTHYPAVNREIISSTKTFVINLHCTNLYCVAPFTELGWKKWMRVLIGDLDSGSDFAPLLGHEWAGYLKNVDGSRFQGKYEGGPVIISPIWISTNQEFYDKHPEVKLEFINALGGLPYTLMDDENNILPTGAPVFHARDSVGYIAIEVGPPAIEKKMTKIYQEVFHRPQTKFFLWLDHEYEPILLRQFHEVGMRATFSDPKLYKTKQFKNYKKSIALLIRRILEWGEKLEATAGK